LNRDARHSSEGRLGSARHSRARGVFESRTVRDRCQDGPAAHRDLMLTTLGLLSPVFAISMVSTPSLNEAWTWLSAASDGKRNERWKAPEAALRPARMLVLLCVLAALLVPRSHSLSQLEMTSIDSRT
jgi:hypothetical protein